MLRRYRSGGPAHIDTLPDTILAGDPLMQVASGVRSFLVLWGDAGVVTLVVLVLLGGMLVAGLCVLLAGMRRQVVLARQARTVAEAFWVAPNLYEALKRLEPDSAYRRIAQTGVEAVTHSYGQLTDRIGTSEWIAISLDRAVRELSESLQGRAGALALIASVAMGVSLAGVTRALAGSFVSAAAGTVPAELPLHALEALWMATSGFAVAVVAATGYGWLTQRNARATGRAREFAEIVRALLQSADRFVVNEGGDPAVTRPSRDRVRAGVAAR